MPSMFIPDINIYLLLRYYSLTTSLSYKAISSVVQNTYTEKTENFEKIIRPFQEVGQYRIFNTCTFFYISKFHIFAMVAQRLITLQTVARTLLYLLRREAPELFAFPVRGSFGFLAPFALSIALFLPPQL